MKAQELLLASELTSGFPKIRTILADRFAGTKIMIVPTAAYGEGWKPDYESHYRPFEEMGFEVIDYDLVGKTPDEVKAALNTVSAVYMSGGNTFYLLHHMRKSGFFDHVRVRISEGVVYIGSSAGSIVATPVISYADALDDRSKAEETNDIGLNLVNFSILPHMDHPSFSALVQKTYKAFEGNGTMCLGLNDDQVIHVVGDSFKVI
ncbi:dipeptidase E [Phyllobacterium sp. CL33Tsu]|nr:dipeptidase E [Phyllobacterium sp. CL33Tsu]